MLCLTYRSRFLWLPPSLRCYALVVVFGALFDAASPAGQADQERRLILAGSASRTPEEHREYGIRESRASHRRLWLDQAQSWAALSQDLLTPSFGPPGPPDAVDCQECMDEIAACLATCPDLDEAVLPPNAIREPIEPTEELVVSIAPGPGGREAEDWRDMLVRMYIGWAEAAGQSLELLDEGSARVLVLGSAHAGKGIAWFDEVGVHRLVRVSPHDRAGRVHSSFVHVQVSPHCPLAVSQVDLLPSDVEVFTMKSSGPGGQHVNKTESAVRLVHTPTGCRVVVRRGRSQHENKRVAWSLLAGKVAAVRDEKARAAGPARVSDDAKGWGNQIRTYHLPDDRVVDHRRGTRLGSAKAWLAGRDRPE